MYFGIYCLTITLRKSKLSTFSYLYFHNKLTLFDQFNMRVFFFLMLLISSVSYAQPNSVHLLVELDELIESRGQYFKEKQERILKIKQEFNLSNETLEETYNYNLLLSKEYQSFKFDSAYLYANELIKIASEIQDVEKVAVAKIEFADILISSGLFNEAIDTLETIKLSEVCSQIKGDYYVVMSRGYFDLESFSQSKDYSEIYRQQGVSFFDSALVYLPSTEWKYHSIKAQWYLKHGQDQRAIETIDSIFLKFNLGHNDLATLNMTRAFALDILGEKEDALCAMIQASVSDFKAAKKEAVAFLFTANYLFERDDVMRSSKYINVALEDYRFYGSSFRLWQISQYLPVIKSQHIVTVEEQKSKLFYFSIIVSFLIVTVFGAIFIIYKQFSVVRKANKEVEHTNKQLAKINEELAVTNRIKEEYIGYFFSVNTLLLEKLDKFKGSINRKYKRKQFDEIAIELNNLSIPQEKEIMLENFDKVFLKIYPDFVAKLNKLMKKGEEINLKEGQLLNTELRIFALVRLGIHNPEKLAKILDYSLNTIYAYKNRIKTRSICPNDEFEKEVMKIKHF